jgi:hypothetical protein
MPPGPKNSLPPPSARPALDACPCPTRQLLAETITSVDENPGGNDGDFLTSGPRARLNARHSFVT